MTPLLAHASHWLVNLLYVAPLVIVVGVLAVQKLRDSRRKPDAPIDDVAEARP